MKYLIMRAVDPQVAVQILHRLTPVPPVIPTMNTGRGPVQPGYDSVPPEFRGVMTAIPMDPRQRS